MPRRPREWHLIGYASGLGARNRGCADGPAAFRAHGVQRPPNARWQAILSAEPAGTQDVLPSVSRLCAALADQVAASLASGAFPIVVGGDHSCAVGTWSGAWRALRSEGPLGLIWIDAHLDAHTPETSPSGALHGMPLACLLGHGDPALTGCGGNGPKLDPAHVCVVGARSFEPEEAALLLRLGVRVFSMEEIRRRGLEEVLDEAVFVCARGTAGFGLSVDLDALDPEDAPGVGTPVPGGLRGDEVVAALRGVACDPRLIALEVAELNPHSDPAGRTVEMAQRLIGVVVEERREVPHPWIELESRWGAHNYHPLPVVIARGEGVYVWDDQGRRYLDMLSAYSAVSHGHAHPRLVRALERQARKLAVTSRAVHNDRLPVLLKRLCEVFGFDRALPVNTGLEAVETALKAARRWAYRVKGVPVDQAEIIAARGNFHGRSIAILGLSSEPDYRDGFGPFPPGCVLVPYGDAQALERAITPRTAAFLVEPVQGEGGIIVPPEGYLAQCAEICRRHRVLLICDEVQTGLGRTGRLLACQHEGVQPDGVVLGKALGGGLLPVSAFLAREEVMQVFTPGSHGSTFGGNPLAAAVALEALEVMLEERFAERAQTLGARFLSGLRSIDSPLIRAVRGRGLMIGVEIDPARVNARALCQDLLARGILTLDTHGSVLRFAPPLVIDAERIDWAVARIREAFEQRGCARQAA
ncbi:ornithine--oxo-acid transaminase [Pelomicrobium methylotrophicum]|uniref:Ornithine--oxo-acid aminotransferase n=1 Tax=Pelomicrobium methylotrophicum TaxID=2602750 RepID=A0A5C7EII0_9PROT|nr:ornithine--oxo-acid transaminase [Pelomicrobium methylotrophicum]TXF10684.1 ornithine--oxo-acid transaminase [Pelomicrobium methylotrophicum]